MKRVILSLLWMLVTAWSVQAVEKKITVKDTPLAELASAWDVVRQLAGMEITSEGLMIEGRYKAAIYVGNSPLTQLEQLKRIAASRIDYLEVTMNPDVEYDKEIRALVRIFMITFNENSLKSTSHVQMDLTHLFSYSQSQYLTWHKNRLTLDGALSVRNSRVNYRATEFYQHYRDKADGTGKILADRKTSECVQEKHGCNIDAMASLTWQLAEGHDLSVRYDLTAVPRYPNRTVQKGRVIRTYEADENGKIDPTHPDTETFQALTTYVPDTKHEWNLAYSGISHGWKLTADAKFVWDDPIFTEPIRQDGQMISYTELSYGGWHEEARLMARHTLEGGSFSVGVANNYTHKNIRYDDPYVENDRIHAHAQESTFALFASADKRLGAWNLTGGLRYEYTYYRYAAQDDDEILSQLQQAGVQSLIVTQDHHRLHPNVSLTRTWGPSQWSLSYAQTIRTPDFSDSRVSSSYMEDPDLAIIKAEWQHTTSLSWQYRDLLQASLAHTYFDRPIYESISRYYRYNGDSYHAVDANLSLSPKIACWQPSLVVSLHKQWNDMPTANGVNRLSAALLQIHWNNVLQLPGQWTLFVNNSFRSRGATRNIRMYSVNFNSDISLQKQLCSDRLRLSLSATNLFHSSCTDISLYAPASKGTSDGKKVYEPRTVSFSAIYRWGK